MDGNVGSLKMVKALVQALCSFKTALIKFNDSFYSFIKAVLKENINGIDVW